MASTLSQTSPTRRAVCCGRGGAPAAWRLVHRQPGRVAPTQTRSCGAPSRRRPSMRGRPLDRVVPLATVKEPSCAWAPRARRRPTRVSSAQGSRPQHSGSTPVDRLVECWVGVGARRGLWRHLPKLHVRHSARRVQQHVADRRRPRDRLPRRHGRGVRLRLDCTARQRHRHLLPARLVAMRAPSGVTSRRASVRPPHRCRSRCCCVLPARSSRSSSKCVACSAGGYSSVAGNHTVCESCLRAPRRRLLTPRTPAHRASRAAPRRCPARRGTRRAMPARHRPRRHLVRRVRAGRHAEGLSVCAVSCG